MRTSRHIPGQARMVSCLFAAAAEYVYHGAGNPYLPLWEHIPDGEPRVFEDPDCPGQYRIYVVSTGGGPAGLVRLRRGESGGGTGCFRGRHGRGAF